MISRWWWGPKTAGQIWPKDRAIRSFDGTRIAYTILGPRDAPVISTCAGFVCPDTYWRDIVPPLAERYRVLVWNYRGIGVSGLPRNPGFHARNIRGRDLTIEASARDLCNVLEAEGIERTVAVGHSMGFQVALELYRNFEDRVTALVSLAGAYRSPLRTFYGTDVSARAAPVVLPLLHVLPRVTLLAWRTLLRSPLSFPAGRHALGAVGPGVSPQDMQGYFDHLSMTDPLIAAKMVRGMHDHDASDLLPRVRVPVLILHGTKDPFTPKRVATAMARALPDGRLTFFDGGSHTLPLEFPEEILERLEPFLEEAFAR